MIDFKDKDDCELTVYNIDHLGQVEMSIYSPSEGISFHINMDKKQLTQLIVFLKNQVE